MSTLFISHSSQDDAFVRGLQQSLGLHDVRAWIDSRELLPGGLLDPDIAKAISESSAFAVVVSPASLQSRWIGKELRHALEVQKQRGRDKFPVIPLSLNDTKLGVLEEFFGQEPLYISVSSDAGGIDVALNAILVAMGKRLPADVAVAAQPKAEPPEELVLELTDLKFHEDGGVRRASARARRRRPNTRPLDVSVVATPIRILLVTARPEDDACGYLDHRASALPLVEAMEDLGGLVRLHVLSPPTLSALREELDRARRARAVSRRALRWPRRL